MGEWDFGTAPLFFRLGNIMINSSNYNRIYNIEALRNAPAVTIVGCGTVGSYAAYCLARAGINSFILYDHDKVEEHNVPAQVFRRKDIGLLKVNALKQIILEANPHADIECKDRKYSSYDGTTGINIVGADNMTARHMLFDKCKETRSQLFYDMRIRRESFECFAVRGTDKAKELYESTLFGEGEAGEQLCGDKAVPTIGAVAGGILASMVLAPMSNDESLMNTWRVDGDLLNMTFMSYQIGE